MTALVSIGSRDNGSSISSLGNYVALKFTDLFFFYEIHKLSQLKLMIKVHKILRVSKNKSFFFFYHLPKP